MSASSVADVEVINAGLQAYPDDSDDVKELDDNNWSLNSLAGTFQRGMRFAAPL